MRTRARAGVVPRETKIAFWWRGAQAGPRQGCPPPCEAPVVAVALAVRRRAVSHLSPPRPGMEHGHGTGTWNWLLVHGGTRKDGAASWQSVPVRASMPRTRHARACCLDQLCFRFPCRACGPRGRGATAEFEDRCWWCAVGSWLASLHAMGVDARRQPNVSSERARVHGAWVPGIHSFHVQTPSRLQCIDYYHNVHARRHQMRKQRTDVEVS
ncbi:hypothetical protein C8Q80DRAFT_616674 [Daedaleopsis nitida]|nr:hypothetical protein C8Q80DRAFT_616674 [Daedaleopsis nitida]